MGRAIVLIMCSVLFTACVSVLSIVGGGFIANYYPDSEFGQYLNQMYSNGIEVCKEPAVATVWHSDNAAYQQNESGAWIRLPVRTGGAYGFARGIDTVNDDYLHELGHFIYFNYLGEKAVKQWNAMEFTDYVSEYAKNNVYENFAETFRVYMQCELSIEPQLTFMVTHVEQYVSDIRNCEGWINVGR